MSRNENQLTKDEIDFIRRLRTGDIILNGRRVRKASDAIADDDYVTKRQIAGFSESPSGLLLPIHLNDDQQVTGVLGSGHLPLSGVTAGTYGDDENVAQVTVDNKGRITNISDVPINFPGGGGSAAWELAGTTATTGGTTPGQWDFSSNVSEVIFTDLDDFCDIVLAVRNVTMSASGTRDVRVSINNGSSFLSGASDYEYLDVNGIITTAAAIGLQSTASASARGGQVNFFQWNLSTLKTVHVVHRSAGINSNFIPTANPLNALRINASTGNFTGGQIRVYGRPI